MRVLFACLSCLIVSGCALPPAFNEDTAQLRAALDSGADPNQTWMGSWPLMWNMSSASHQYDPDNPNPRHTDPQVAVANMRLLLKAGADPNQPERWPPLHHAVKYCWPEMVQMLTEAGADPHALAYGDTPMPMSLIQSFCPSVDDQYQVTLQLLNYVEQREGRDAMLAFVNMEARNYSLVHLAAWQQYYGVLAALIEKGVDLNRQVKQVPYLQQTSLEMYCAGCTPLHLAEAVGNTVIADALRRAGAREDIRNANGQTAAELRGRFTPGYSSSVTEKAAAAGKVWSRTASGDLLGLSLMNAEKSMEADLYRRARKIDQPEKERQLYGGPVYPPEDWQGLENAIRKSKNAKRR